GSPGVEPSPVPGTWPVDVPSPRSVPVESAVPEFGAGGADCDASLFGSSAAEPCFVVPARRCAFFFDGVCELDGDPVDAADASEVEGWDDAAEESAPVSARAMPELWAIATPRPSATAKAPTRPTYFAYPAASP